MAKTWEKYPLWVDKIALSWLTWLTLVGFLKAMLHFAEWHLLQKGCQGPFYLNWKHLASINASSHFKKRNTGQKRKSFQWKAASKQDFSM